MKKSRLIALSLSALLLLPLVACNKTADGNVSSPSAPVASPSSPAASPSAPAPAPSTPAEVDTYTTATETKYMKDKVLMERADVEAHIAELLKGPGDYREMYTLGTSFNNVPLTSSIEFVYDPSNMHFYGTSDLGTEKLEQLKRNDSVSLSWVRMLTPEELAAGETYFSISQGVQVNGKAVVIDPESDRYEEIMKIYIPTMGREYTQEYAEKLKAVCAVVEIIPERIIMRDVGLKADGFNYMQKWEAQ